MWALILLSVLVMKTLLFMVCLLCTISAPAHMGLVVPSKKPAPAIFEGVDPEVYIPWNQAHISGTSRFFIEGLFHLTSGQVISKEIRDGYVERMKREAINITLRAYNNPKASASAKNNYLLIWNALETTKIQYPEPGMEFKECEPDEGQEGNTAFFYYDGEIYICNSTLRDYIYPIPQGLIHEAIHAAILQAPDISSEMNECLTTMVEISTMNDAGVKPYKNAYVDECKVSLNYRTR